MMNCSAWQELLDEVALSAMDDGQRAALETHAAVCPDCFALLATERLLAGAWVGARRLRPSARLQSALLAVPRRDRRLRAYSFWAVPVSMLAIGLLAWLAPDVLKRQRAQIDMSAGANAAAATSASRTATPSSPGAASPPAVSVPGPVRLVTDPDVSTTAVPAAAPVAGLRAVSAAVTATPGSPAVGSVFAARERDPRRGGPPAATPTAADLAAGSAGSAPGQPDPNPWPTDPGGDDPSATPEVGPPPGGGSDPRPTETPSPEGPPRRQPDPSTPAATSTPEAPRVGMTPTPTEASGGSAQPVVPPTETPTPTPTVTPTVTTPGTPPTPSVTGF